MASYVLFIYFFTLAISFSRGQDPQMCPPTEVYTKCKREFCYQTCQHFKSPPMCTAPPMDCDDPGCVCVTGWLRNNWGACVPVGNCY